MHFIIPTRLVIWYILCSVVSSLAWLVVPTVWPIKTLHTYALCVDQSKPRSYGRAIYLVWPIKWTPFSYGRAIYLAQPIKCTQNSYGRNICRPMKSLHFTIALSPKNLFSSSFSKLCYSALGSDGVSQNSDTPRSEYLIISQNSDTPRLLGRSIYIHLTKLWHSPMLSDYYPAPLTSPTLSPRGRLIGLFLDPRSSKTTRPFWSRLCCLGLWAFGAEGEKK